MAWLAWLQNFESTALRSWVAEPVSVRLGSAIILSPTLASNDHHINIESLYSCLASNGVQNFTTTPNDNHCLFNHVIQNPIFTRPVFNKPATIVLPQSKEQLATTISCCTHGSWTIRLRSGGHSYEGLSQTAQTPFVIIDLMNLNRVEIDLESETAWVESGATLGEIYYAISQASDELGFSADSSPTVGSGGHISGGGFGMMSRKYGLASIMSSMHCSSIPRPYFGPWIDGRRRVLGDSRKGTLMMVEYIVAWNMDEDLESHKFLSWLNELYEYVGQFIVDGNPRVSYVNHVDFDLGEIDWRNESSASNAIEISRKWGEKYFLSNYDRLVRAKTDIDPNNVFQHPQSIPPLLGLIKNNKDEL
ncbi:hypothetical protein Syun_031672 [Stephania yunnanensis]|uniref:FAD-binding PCMH-type domain-containing protein n=1 Tax=Stephania yunnanensis TaxID=152371 RepID=A0AAP0HB16_9MAGN